jgi:opacity protein-like surface antigen
MRIVLFASLLIALMSASAAAQNTTRVAENQAWSVYIHETEDGKRICFAASEPKDSSSEDSDRSGVYFYVTNWVEDGITNELSVKNGYEFKEGSAPTVSVGGSDFEMFVRGDKAFLRDPEDEKRLLGKMKAGATMTVSGESADGKQTTDTYSLYGLTASVGKLNEECS